VKKNLSASRQWNFSKRIKNSELRIMNKKKTDNIDKIRHSLSHLLAMAILEKFPGAKLGIGPTIENGFYYDFDLPRQLSADELPALEKRMRELAKQDLKFKKENISFAEAKKMFSKQPFKLELINELNKNKQKISIYKTGSFIDLCAGPHVSSTKEISQDAFKLEKTAGAYWRGDEKNPMLTRIYGIAFNSKKDLDEHINLLAEAEKRDHKKLGPELDLFTFSELVGAGLPLYTFRGTLILNELKKYINELQGEIGYQEVQTPSMNRAELFKISGHYEKYKEDMFSVHSNYTKEEYFLKPMNCPQHTQIFASKPRSYKDLPIRVTDFSQLHRDEKTGELSGLTRLRGFRQDDGHSFCREDQIREEFKSVLSVIEKVMKTFKMDYEIRLSLWDLKTPEKYLGDAKTWKKSQQILEKILIENKIKYFKAVGEAAIYGPKMDLISKDSLGRKWQLSTIQLDFIMPARFKLSYIDSDGKEKTPVMIHRAIVGSPERFLGVLIEHYAGAFPLWLTPVQAKILPISQKQESYGKKVLEFLRTERIRAEMDDPNETLGKRIREAEMQKIPYILVLGEKEFNAKTVNVRHYQRGQEGEIEIKSLLEKIRKEIDGKK
jgi:threonyl-tRNA synthetase